MKKDPLYLCVLLSALLHGLFASFGLLLWTQAFEPALPGGQRAIQVRVLGQGESRERLQEAGPLSRLSSKGDPKPPSLLLEPLAKPPLGGGRPQESASPVLVRVEPKERPEEKGGQALRAVRLADGEGRPPASDLHPALTPRPPAPSASPPSLLPPTVLSRREVPTPSPPAWTPTPMLARVIPEAQRGKLSSPQVLPAPSEAPSPFEFSAPRSLSDLSTEGIFEKYARVTGRGSEGGAKKGEEGEEIPLETQNPLFQTYFAQIRLRIERELFYPPEAERQKVRGQALVRFVLVESGNLAELRLLDPSGYSILDEASLSAIRRASPFGPFPAEIRAKWRQLPIRAKFRFGQ